VEQAVARGAEVLAEQRRQDEGALVGLLGQQPALVLLQDLVGEGGPGQCRDEADDQDDLGAAVQVPAAAG
jgi:hypothetical protein